MTKEQLEAVVDALAELARDWNEGDDDTGCRNDYLCLTLADDGSGSLGRRHPAGDRVEDFHDFDGLAGLAKVLADQGVDVGEDASAAAMAERRLAQSMAACAALDSQLRRAWEQRDRYRAALMDLSEVNHPEAERIACKALEGKEGV